MPPGDESPRRPLLSRIPGLSRLGAALGARRNDAVVPCSLEVSGEEIELPDNVQEIEIHHEPVAPLPDHPSVGGFVNQYELSMDDYEHLRLDGEDVRNRIDQLLGQLATENITNYGLENFSEALFAFQALRNQLNALNAAVGEMEDGEDKNRVRDMVLDLILFSSFVPTREYHRKVVGNFSEVSRYTLQALTPAQVIDALASMRQQLGEDGNIHNAAVFQHLHLAGDDSIQQRMLKIALMSTPAAKRAAIYNDDLFTALLGGGHIFGMMFASTGADEQYFLNTCPISARNTDMAARTSNLITLLHAGDKVIDALRLEVANASAEVTGQRLTMFQTVGGLVEKRCDDAQAVFASIRNELQPMLAGEANFDYGRVKKLRRKWSRAMQKLGGVAKWTDPNEIPQLSKKYINDHYYGSAVLAAFVGLTANPLLPNTRTTKRVMGPDDARYTELTSKIVDSHVSEDTVAMQTVEDCSRLWAQLYKTGGSPFSANSAAGTHALYIKAIMHGGEKKFAINDPMQRSFAYLNMNQMETYIAGDHAPRISSGVIDA